jgi:dTDP-4-dehydrorhamnose 3,5-epimerase
MRFLTTELRGVILIEPDLFRDARGFFLETFHERKYREGGVDAHFVQDNHSRSVRGTLRGLHAQKVRPQGKLVRAVKGEIFDVAVDIDPASPTFGRHVFATLSDENFRQMYVPPGYAHGFCVLSEVADVLYKQTAYYDPALERGIAFDDPDVAIAWPLPREQLIVSERDAAAPRLSEIADELPFRWHP